MAYTRRCGKGKIFRRGYTRKNTGTRVRGACIRSTSPYGPKQDPRIEATRHKRIQAARLGRALGTRKRCPPGQIQRNAYVRRISNSVARAGYTRRTKSGKLVQVFPKAKSVYVPAGCVKDVGKPGELPAGAPVIGPLRKGELKKHGYSYKLPEAQRHNALRRAVREYGVLSTYRKLNAVSKLTEGTSPAASSAFAADRNWIRATYAKGGKINAF